MPPSKQIYNKLLQSLLAGCAFWTLGCASVNVLVCRCQEFVRYLMLAEDGAALQKCSVRATVQHRAPLR